MNMIVAIIYFVKKNNELPFFLALFNVIVEYRVIALELGKTKFVNYDYGINFSFSMDYAYIASNMILLGTSIMMYSYMLFYKPGKKTIKDNNQLLKLFVGQNRKIIIIGLCIFSLISIVVSGSDVGGYSTLIRVGTSSFIILLFLVIFFLNSKNRTLRIWYVVIFIFLAAITYSTALRFQFLGWIIPIGYFWGRNLKPARKITLCIGGLFLVLLIFSLAGAMRNSVISGKGFSEVYQLSLDRLEAAEDVNFIDGFIMLYQIYPDVLDYDYGLEHVEILLRPIPRALWPDKPQASWVRKYQEKYSGNVSDSAGFSPTIWGVFYSEGGVPGIIILSILWAWFLSYIYRSFSSAFNSDLSVLLIGILLSSLIPIFRSGDMAGDFAIVLMSYWPIIVFARSYKKFVKRRLKLELRKKLFARWQLE